MSDVQKRGESLRILLVEDSLADAKLVMHEIRRANPAAFFERVDDESSMRKALATERWDAIISDWSLPRFSAPAALAVLQSTGLDLPFIIVSATMGEDKAVDAMRAGAHDYVLKDHLARLAPAVEREIRDCKEREVHRRQEARFRALVEKSTEGIFIKPLAGPPTYVSPATAVIFGVPLEDLQKESFLEFIHLEDRAFVAAAVNEIRSQPNLTIHSEFRVSRPDGAIRWVEATSTNLVNDPIIAGIVTSVRDVTEKKRIEQALQESVEHLRQAQKMEAVGRLAGGVAHDFNNVLSVILSYSDVLCAELGPEDPMRDDLQQISLAGKRAADLTRQLLMFSRQQLLEPQILNLNNVLAGLDKMLPRLLGEDVEIESFRAPDLRMIQADPSSVEQVVMNLVVNARDAMPTGGKLTIRTENVELDEAAVARLGGKKSGPHVELSIADTGTGMDAATMAHIFEPFYTTKSKDKGTGLGLSTVFGIVTQTGGAISVTSEVGAGTTFHVYLPCTEGDATRSFSSDENAVAGGNETILLVEDEEQVRAVARGILRKNGYIVLEARNPAEALLMCEEHPSCIDLLLSDVVMPNMSGPELATRLQPLRPQMKVLFMSGYTDDSRVRHGIEHSSIAFLQKPFTPASLSRKVRSVLDET